MRSGSGGWHGAPDSAEVEVHANRYGVGTWPVLAGSAHTDWATAPKVRGGRWLVRRRHSLRGKELRAARGWEDPDYDMSLLLLAAHDKRVWCSANDLFEVDLATTRWAASAEFRPVDADGSPVPWPNGLEWPRGARLRVTGFAEASPSGPNNADMIGHEFVVERFGDFVRLPDDDDGFNGSSRGCLTDSNHIRYWVYGVFVEPIV